MQFLLYYTNGMMELQATTTDTTPALNKIYLCSWWKWGEGEGMYIIYRVSFH